MRSFLAALAAVFFLLTAAASFTTQVDSRLDELFTRLKTTTDPIEAENLQEFIWQLWIETENEEILNLFARCRELMLRDDHATALDLATKTARLDPGHAEG